LKKILFVINTLGQAGAETALAELLWNLNPGEYEISLLVLMEQGEMIRRIPDYVKVLSSWSPGETKMIHLMRQGQNGYKTAKVEVVVGSIK